MIQAENGRAALDIMDSKKGKQVDIILTDNIMPEVNATSQTPLDVHPYRPSAGLLLNVPAPCLRHVPS